LDMAPAALGAARAGPLHAWWGARRATQWHATVLIEGTTMTMTETPDTADDLDEPIVAGDLPAAAPDEDAPLAAPEPAALGDVDLPVHVEIDTLSLSIAELAALRPGYVLELPLAARDVPVRLVAYGQAIGGGRLVAVGAHLGVRIDRMAGDDGSV
ncbi:type III secretion system cytoplasmic ring protein SctQ, partial [Burkholderia lata]